MEVDLCRVRGDGVPTLLIDYGGVLTSSVPAAFANVCGLFGVDLNGFMSRCQMGDPAGPFSQLEMGVIDDVEFARVITPVLTEHADTPVDGLAWVRELQKTSFDVERTMLAAVAELIDNGVPTVLFSNSFGPLERYPWALLPKFTDTVISSVVGMRKPDPGIYELALQRCGRPAQECVFIDDSEVNLAPAQALGIRSIHHQNPATTVAELKTIFG